MEVTGFSPARTGEVYALWLAFPKTTAHGKQQPQHGDSEFKLVSTFNVSSTGELIGFDANKTIPNLPKLELALQAEITIEKLDSISEEPELTFLAGPVEGTTNQGTATLVIDHHDAVGLPFAIFKAEATLASPDSSPNDYHGELYLMNATNATSPGVSLGGYLPLGTRWKYGLWFIDSATQSAPPFNFFYGYITGVAEADSYPTDNRFDFPGGRYPASSSQSVYPLNSGQVTVMVSLEPNLHYTRPSVPFGAILLETKVPKDQRAFTPISLTNLSAKLPKAVVTINR